MIGEASRSTLRPRLLAAAILIPSALLAAYLGGIVLALFTAAAGIAMAREWVRIVHREDFEWRFALHAAALVVSQTLLAFGHADWGVVAILFFALIGSVFHAERAL